MVRDNILPYNVVSKENTYLGAVAEAFVVARLLQNGIDAYTSPFRSAGADVVAVYPCFHTELIQTKKVYENAKGKESFHAGDYHPRIRLYGLVCDDGTVYFIPTSLVSANSHASLSGDLVAASVSLPTCRECE